MHVHGAERNISEFGKGNLIKSDVFFYFHIC